MRSIEGRKGRPTAGFRVGMEISTVRELHTLAVLCHRYVHGSRSEGILLCLDDVPRIWLVTARTEVLTAMMSPMFASDVSITLPITITLMRPEQ